MLASVLFCSCFVALVCCAAPLVVLLAVLAVFPAAPLSAPLATACTVYLAVEQQLSLTTLLSIYILDLVSARFTD